MLNVHCIVAVVTGSTIKMEARFDRFGNAALISAVSSNTDKTFSKELLL